MFIMVDGDWLRSVKLKKLRRLEIHEPMLFVLRTWKYALDECGDTAPALTPEDIDALEMAVDWDGPDGALVAAFRSVGVLDGDTLDLWWEDGPGHLNNFRKKDRDRKKKARAAKAVQRTTPDVPRTKAPVHGQDAPSGTAERVPRTTHDVPRTSADVPRTTPNVPRTSSGHAVHSRSRGVVVAEVESLELPRADAPERAPEPEPAAQEFRSLGLPERDPNEPREWGSTVKRRKGSWGTAGPEFAEPVDAFHPDHPSNADPRSKKPKTAKPEPEPEAPANAAKASAYLKAATAERGSSWRDRGKGPLSADGGGVSKQVEGALHSLCKAMGERSVPPMAQADVYTKHRVRLEAIARGKDAFQALNKAGFKVASGDIEPNAALAYAERCQAGGAGVPTTREIKQAWGQS